MIRIYKTYFVLVALLLSHVALAQPISFEASIGTPANGSSHFISLNCSAVGGATFEVEASVDNSIWNNIYSGASLNFNHNTGNLANSPFYYRIRSVAGGVPSAWKNATQFPIHTAADDPALPILSNAGTTTMNLVLQDEVPVANPANTTYSIFEQNTGLFVQANGTLGISEVFQTKAVWSTVNLNGLSPNTNYCFYAKARNQDGYISIASGNAIIPKESFDNTNNFSTQSGSGPTNRYWSPSSCTTGGLTWNATNGCPGGAVGFQGSFNNFFGCFLRSPAINATGLNEVEITFDVTHTFSAATATNRMRIYFFADGSFNSSSITSLEINGVNKLASFGVNGQGILYDEARTCAEVKVKFNIAAVGNKSNILFYLEPNSNFNNSFVFATWIDNVSINGNANASVCLSTLSCIPVSLVTSPTNSVICENGNASFSVATSGSVAQLQWQESQNNGLSWNNLSNGGSFSGVNAATLSISNVPLTMNGNLYRCVITAACGGNITSNSAVLVVNSLPGNAGIISGSTALCSSQGNFVYEVAAVNGATGYNWTLPSGASIVSGQNTNQITVNFSNMPAIDSIQVAPSNSCGNGASSPWLPISFFNSVPAAPVFVDTSALFCANDTATIEVIQTQDAQTYQWTVPTSWYSNNATAHAIRLVPDTSTNATVSVTAENLCGVSAANSFSLNINDTLLFANLNPQSFFNNDTAFVCGTPPFLIRVSVFPVPNLNQEFEWEVTSLDTNYSVTASFLSFPSGVPLVLIDTVSKIRVRAVNVCKNDYIDSVVIVLDNVLPQVSYIPSKDLFCLVPGLDTLGGGLPKGGVYSGLGVVNDTMFSADMAGIGTHTITYTVTAENGCANQAIAEVEVDICVGIGENDLANFNVFPNPFSQLIHIENFDAEQVAIVDLLGRNVAVSIEKNTNDMVVYPSSKISDGIYFLILKDKKGNVFQRKITRIQE